MAKRKKNVTEVKPEAPKKVATPENPKPPEPSAVQVNPMYDEMPDEIDDPANVYRMAMLDMRRAAIHNKLAFIAQDQERKVQAAVRERDRLINEAKIELREAEAAFIAQKQFIEEKYHIALRSYTYNDETGVLKKQAIFEKEDEEQPAAPAAGEKEKTLH
jgi:hypothetical protein